MQIALDYVRGVPYIRSMINDSCFVRVNMQIQMERTYTSEVRAKIRKRNDMPPVGVPVGRLCYSDDLPPSILEDDHFAIQRFSGIKALDVRRVQRINLYLHRAH